MSKEREILKKMPLLRFTNTDQETALMCEQPWLIHAQEAEGYLVLSYFEKGTPVTGLPYARTAFSREEFITERPGLKGRKRFTSASFEFSRDEKMYSIFSRTWDCKQQRYFSHFSFASYAEMEETSSMLRTFTENPELKDIRDLVYEVQRQVMDERLRVRQEKRRRKEKEEWGCVNPIPDGFWRFAESHILKESQYGTYEGRTNLSCQCGMCGEKFVLHRKKDSVKRGVQKTCPNCGRTITLLSAGRLPYKWDTDHVAMVDPGDGKRTIFRIFEFIREWKKAENGEYMPINRNYEKGRIIIYTDIKKNGPSNCQRYRTYALDWKAPDNDRGWRYSPSNELRPPRLFSYYECDPAWCHYLYPEGLNKTLGTLPAASFGLEEYARGGHKERFASYMIFYPKRMNMKDKKKLAQMGRVKTAFNVFDHVSDYMTCVDGKDLTSGLDAKHLRTLFEFEKDSEQIFNYAYSLLANQQKLLVNKKSAKHVTAEDIRFFIRNGIANYTVERLAEQAASISFGKLSRYLEKETKDGLPMKNAIDLLVDYIRMRKECGLSCKAADICPKGLQNAHDAMIGPYNEAKKEEERRNNEELTKLIKTRAEALEKILKEVMAQEDGLIAHFPQSAGEFIAEGEALHHCVSRYKQSFAKGETIIVFIRDVSAPDKPYYTLEVKNGRIIQLHGKYNDIHTETIMQEDGTTMSKKTIIPIPEKVQSFAEKIAQGLQAA